MALEPGHIGTGDDQVAHDIAERRDMVLRLGDLRPAAEAKLGEVVAQRDELLGRLQRENSALKTDLDDSRSRLANAEAVAESLAQTVRDIYGSTSWEITKPMRAVVSFLRSKRVRFR